MNRNLGKESRLAGAQHDVVVVRQHDRFRGAGACDRVQELLCGRVHRLAAVDDAGRAHALEEPAVALAGYDRHDGRPPIVGSVMREPLLALSRLQLHVRDLDALDRADGGACPERGPGIVRVDVRLQRRLVADHEQRIPEGREVALQILSFEPLALDDEARAVAVARSRQVHGVRRQLRRRCGLGERLTREACGDPAHDLDEARGSRVDDARRPQLLELPLRPCDSLVSVGDECGEQLRGGIVAAALGLVGQLADDREDRPLDRLAHRGVGGVRCSSERRRNRTVGLVALHGASDDLRQDHARVPPRSEQRGAHHVVVARLERLAHCAHGEQHVRAGVAVGDGIDVEVVDARAAAFERAFRRTHELELVHARVI